ncbi:ferrous iron transporter B [Alteromonadaceae bacterium M269]|nr:ferrous iron transporter B [Alteromonadaceae bacterium M269]
MTVINSSNSNILLIGKPNSGKSLLFNQLTGLRQKVANYPGVTVDIKRGKFNEHELIDLPGTYSLHSLSQDEAIAIEHIQNSIADNDTRVVVCVLDATRLERSLVLGLQVQALAKQHNKAVVFALNLIDEVRRFNHQIDLHAFEKELGSPIVALSAKKLDGLHEFTELLKQAAETPENYLVNNIDSDSSNELIRSRELAKRFGMNLDVVLKDQNRIDNFMLNSVFGGLAFLAIMFVLFQSIFTLATPLMDGVEVAIGALGSQITQFMGEGTATDFVQDALFGGVGSFLVFVPQIMILTLIIGLLEDSGYLARAALMCHRPLSYFGLSGRSFIPYLSGHACAIPAIMAARTIESPHKRLMTMLTIPLMSCSARLPVYALLIAVLIPSDSYWLGLFNLQGVAFFGLYFFGIVMALIVSLILNKLTKVDLDKSDMPFILELPSYRLPHWKPLFQKVLNSAHQFIKRAAPIIFMVSVIIWVLGYFPSGASLDDSWLGMLGQWIEPIFAPLGLDWRYGVAILMSFLAREVFVGSLGTLFGISDAEENLSSLADKIQADGLTLGAGVGLVLFYVVALQCVATVATLKGETGKAKIAWGIFLAYGSLAYLIAFLANQILN